MVEPTLLRRWWWYGISKNNWHRINAEKIRCHCIAMKNVPKLKSIGTSNVVLVFIGEHADPPSHCCPQLLGSKDHSQAKHPHHHPSLTGTIIHKWYLVGLEVKGGPLGSDFWLESLPASWLSFLHALGTQAVRLTQIDAKGWWSVSSSGDNKADEV